MKVLVKPKLKRLKDVDVAIGIAILLVVYGHLLFDVKDLDWFVNSRKVIYKFHMPLFMFLSGLLMSYSYKPITSFKEYLLFIKKKIKKFLPAYLIFSFIFIVFDIVFYDISISDIKNIVIATLIFPAESSAGFLWYVYVLILFYLILPLLMWVAKKYVLVLLGVSIILQFVNVTKWFGLNFFAFYFLFITLGLIVNKYLPYYYKYLSRLGFIFVLLFVTVLIAITTDFVVIPKTIIGLCSIPAIHYISVMITSFLFADELGYIGRHSFYIYLMNTLIMGALFLAFTKVLNIENLVLIAPILFIAGAYGPILIYNRIIRKIPVLNKLIP